MTRCHLCLIHSHHHASVRFIIIIIIIIKTCQAGLALSVTRILRAALTKFRVYVCMHVCVCNYSSQTTEPICIKLCQQIERLTLIAIGHLDLKYLTPPYLKHPKTHFWGPRNVKPMGNRGLL